MIMEETNELCIDCFLEHMFKINIKINIFVNGKESSNLLQINFFACPSCQILKKSL